MNDRLLSNPKKPSAWSLVLADDDYDRPKASVNASPSRPQTRAQPTRHSNLADGFGVYHEPKPNPCICCRRLCNVWFFIGLFVFLVIAGLTSTYTAAWAGICSGLSQRLRWLVSTSPAPTQHKNTSQTPGLLSTNYSFPASGFPVPKSLCGSLSKPTRQSSPSTAIVSLNRTTAQVCSH